MGESKPWYILDLFADILDYPRPTLAQNLLKCEVSALGISQEAGGLLRAFRSFAEKTPLEQMEEIYSGFFDLNPICYPYVGYQLFGESYWRSLFLLGLKESYRAKGFVSAENELPDRLSIMLRFLAMGNDDGLNEEIVEEGLLPALDRMTELDKEGKPPTYKVPQWSGTQLEGHSYGEILTGGFVHEMIKDDTGGDMSKPHKHPYRQALVALKLLLRSPAFAIAERRRMDISGGRENG